MAPAAYDPALADLLQELSPALVLYARTWAGRNEAEDVVQRVCVRLLSRKRSIDDIRPWLFRCVRNEAISFRRSLRRRWAREQKVAIRSELDFAPSAGESIDAKEAQLALEKLPKRQREIVVLRIWSGLTLAEASTVLGAPVQHCTMSTEKPWRLYAPYWSPHAKRSRNNG